MDVALHCPEVWKHAVEIFGTEEKATVWFHTRLSELHDKSPAELLQNEPDSSEVEAVLQRIEYGVFS